MADDVIVEEVLIQDHGYIKGIINLFIFIFHRDFGHLIRAQSPVECCYCH